MRLTRKIKAFTIDNFHFQASYDYYRNKNGFTTVTSEQIMDKLGRLEDVEEELGIPLDLFVKAITGNVYVKGKEPEWAGVGTKKDIQRYRVLSFTVNELVVRFGGDGHDTHVIERPLSKLGKTWALTREELQ